MQARQVKQELEKQLTATVPMEDVEALRETNAILQEELEDVHAALQAADEIVRAPHWGCVVSKPKWYILQVLGARRDVVLLVLNSPACAHSKDGGRLSWIKPLEGWSKWTAPLQQCRYTPSANHSITHGHTRSYCIDAEPLCCVMAYRLSNCMASCHSKRLKHHKLLQTTTLHPQANLQQLQRVPILPPKPHPRGLEPPRLHRRQGEPRTGNQRTLYSDCWLHCWTMRTAAGSGLTSGGSCRYF